MVGDNGVTATGLCPLRLRTQAPCCVAVSPHGGCHGHGTVSSKGGGHKDPAIGLCLSGRCHGHGAVFPQGDPAMGLCPLVVGVMPWWLCPLTEENTVILPWGCAYEEGIKAMRLCPSGRC